MADATDYAKRLREIREKFDGAQSKDNALEKMRVQRTVNEELKKLRKNINTRA
jgi:hypothetical protein